MHSCYCTLGGSGFGLFISKGIVDLHEGSISVFSAGEGHGCSFILSMPMTRAVAAGNGQYIPYQYNLNAPSQTFNIPYQTHSLKSSE